MTNPKVVCLLPSSLRQLSHGRNNDDSAMDHDNLKNYVNWLNVGNYHTHINGLIKAQYSLSDCASCGRQRCCIVEDVGQHYDLAMLAIIFWAGITML